MIINLKIQNNRLLLGLSIIIFGVIFSYLLISSVLNRTDNIRNTNSGKNFARSPVK